MSKINKQKKECAALRTSLTKTLSNLKLELEKTSLDKSVVLDTTMKLDELMNRLKTYDDSIIDLMSELADSNEQTIYTSIRG